MNPVLSILTPTLPSRQKQYNNLMSQLLPQVHAVDAAVEVLSLSDNYTMTIGEKRNKLISISTGDYVAFIDDDDEIASTYIKDIIQGINTNPGVDTINFRIVVNFLDRNILCSYDLRNNDFELIADNLFVGRGWHLHAWRRSIAESIPYKHISFKEDMDWATRACNSADTQYQIDKILYSYNYNSIVSESRNKIVSL